jgi:hypothetical protein
MGVYNKTRREMEIPMNDLPHEYFRRAADRMRAELEQVRRIF